MGKGSYLKIAVGLLTRYNALNAHLTLLEKNDDPVCPPCREE